MNAQSHLDFGSAASSNPGLPAAGSVQAPSATPIEPSCPGRVTGQSGDRRETVPAGRGGSGDLMDQYRPRDPAPPAFFRYGGMQRDVVGDDDDLDRDPLRPGHLGSESEIEPVARVVLDDQDSAGRTGDGPDRRKHGVGAGRREDVARDSRVSIPSPT